jgi:hypothetical protein
MRGRLLLLALLLLSIAVAASALGGAVADGRVANGPTSAYEVWAIDQSDTTPDGGGTLYIYDGESLAGPDGGNTPPEVVDLGGAARTLCLEQTGTAPRRPHMFEFNHRNTHAVISFVTTGHVLFLDAGTRSPVACLDVGAQAHAAHPTHDDAFAIVANQGGKLLQRIATDYEANTFTLENTATIDLATCTTPSGAPCEDPALRPDNAPICPVLESSNRFGFVTLRGGGLFVVDITTTPMRIVAEYDKDTVHSNGCGGVQAGGRMYVNSGGGTTANPTEHDLYRFTLKRFSGVPSPPNRPAPKLVYSLDDRGDVDGHGAALTKPAIHFHGQRMQDGPFLWVGDRMANRIVVVNPRRETVIGEFSLVGAREIDPAPDIFDISPDGEHVFIAFRGPNPLTGNVPGVDNAVGDVPGVGVVDVKQAGRRGGLRTIARITHLDSEGIERADPHSVRARLK